MTGPRMPGTGPRYAHGKPGQPLPARRCDCGTEYKPKRWDQKFCGNACPALKAQRKRQAICKATKKPRVIPRNW